MRIQTTPLGRNTFKRSVAIITAALFMFMGLPNHMPQTFAKSANDIQVRGGNPPKDLSSLIRDEEIRIPPELGLVEESFRGTSGKTILYIQDAHDSLEAQENIAKIINHLVSSYGVQTVFEEGYEGPVPTDKYFGFIKDPKIKEKVSYFLMDHLRVGGAEYAHINRTKDFSLIGADSLKLHKENIVQYRLSASKKDVITKDFKTLEKELKMLTDARFPKELKEWLKTHEQFDAKKFDLFTYLGRTMPLLGKRGAEKGFGLISFILEAIRSNDPAVIEKAKHIDAREVFAELIKLEQAVVENYLHDVAGKQLFEYYKILGLLRRLNDLQVSQDEYEVVKTSLRAFDTSSFARFIFNQAPKTLILSRMWERNIKDSLQFYEIAAARDGAIEKSFAGFLNMKTSLSPAVLVYGGFHKENIKRILEAKGISYLVVSPHITKPSLRHEEFYKHLMTDGRLSYEFPANPHTASRPETQFEIWKDSQPLALAELRIMASVAERMPGIDTPSLLLAMEQALKTSTRSEVRNEKPDDVRLAGIDQALKNWINMSLNRPIETPLDWASIDESNKRFKSSRETQNDQVAKLWKLLEDLMAGHQPRALTEELSKSRQTGQKPNDAPPIFAVAVPNTVVFAAKLKEMEGQLSVVDSDLMSAGKVISAGETLVALGRQVNLVTLVGSGPVGKRFQNYTEQIGFETVVPVETQEDTRFAPNIVRDEDAHEWHFSAPGSLLNQTEIIALRDATEKVLSSAPKGSIVLMGGKVPLGTDISFWEERIRQANSRGLVVYFDNLETNRSSQELQRILAAGVYLIKPNLDEFSNLTGKDRKLFESDLEGIVSEVRSLMNSVNKQGGNLHVVVVSLAERGALLVTSREAYHAVAPKIKVDNTLGAGDALVGALAHKLSLDRPLDEAIQFAVSVATISSQKSGVVRVATPEEADAFSSKITVTPVNVPVYLEPTKVSKAWGSEYILSGETQKHPSVKVLTLNDSVAAQFHDEKDELLIITKIDPVVANGAPRILLGFSAESKTRYGSNIKREYRQALERYADQLIVLIHRLKETGYEGKMLERHHVIPVVRKVQNEAPSREIGEALTAAERAREQVEFFYNYVEVKEGDVVIVPKGLLHAAGPGIQIYEPQLPGETLSFDDADKYPVRYAPANAPESIRQGAQGILAWEKIDTLDENIVWQRPVFKVISDKSGTKIEELSESIHPRVLNVHRINMNKGSEIRTDQVTRTHLLNVTSGSAKIFVNGKSYDIPKAAPGEKALSIPETIAPYTVIATSERTQIIDTSIQETPMVVRSESRSESFNTNNLPENLFEFENKAISIALRFFDSSSDASSLQRELLQIHGVQRVDWKLGELTIISSTTVVKLHPKELEINERLGLKDRFYVRTSQGGEIAIKIYRRDGRDDTRKRTGPVYVLGVVRNSHDSGAALLKDGVLIGGIEEERLNMDKHTRAYFPKEAMQYLLTAHGISWEDIDHIAVTYDYNFFRDTPHSLAPYTHFREEHNLPGLASEAAGRYDTDRLDAFLKKMAREHGTTYVPPVTFVKHHKTHAAAAWYSSGFPEPTLAVVIDGRGEDEATSIWLADKVQLTKVSSTPYVHSLGHFYHIVTKSLGYKSHDEGKVMGYAPYGAPRDKREEERVDKLRALMKELIWFNPVTGQVEMNQQDFNFTTLDNFEEIDFSKVFTERLSVLVPSMPKDKLGRNLTPENRPYAQLTFTMQERVEQVISEMITFYLHEYPATKGTKHVVMAGGLALNILANGKLIENKVVEADKFFVPAYPADDGTPVGAAQSVANEEYGLNVHHPVRKISLGRTYSDEEVQSVLDRFGLVEDQDYVRVGNDDELIKAVADSITSNETVAWFQGGSELGPRALGNRSILNRLDDPEGNLKVNRIKNREPWRPSALSIQEERASEFLDGISIAPFMTIGFPVARNKKDVIKAGVHPEDGRTRPQTVSRDANPLYWALLQELGKRTGVPGVLNTSFNRWGPIVETPEDALNTFYYGEGTDLLAIGHFIVRRTDRLKPSILNGLDEPSLRDQYSKARYHAKPMAESWEAFWKSATDLTTSRKAKHQHYLVVHTTDGNKQGEILRVPLIKEIFQKGPREVIITDLVGRINQSLGSYSKATISLEVTAREYADVVVGLFNQLAPSDVKAKLDIVKFDSNDYPNPLVGLTDQEVRGFVRDILADRFSRNGINADLVDQTLKYAIANRFDPEHAVQEIYRHATDFSDRSLRTPFHDYYYGPYKNEIKPRLISELVKGKIKGPVVVDAGAGMSALALSILKEQPEIKRFISTHNIDYGRVKIEDSRMEFVREETEGNFRIPIEDGIADTVIITGRMHHLYLGKEAEFLKEISRILRPGGQVLVIEDAWSDQLPVLYEDKFTERFRNLSPQQKQRVTEFLDWIGTRVIPGAVSMPRPWNFKSLEEWDRGVFEPAGLKIVSATYHGFQDEKFTALPLSTIELKSELGFGSIEEKTGGGAQPAQDSRSEVRKMLTAELPQSDTPKPITAELRPAVMSNAKRGQASFLDFRKRARPQPADKPWQILRLKQDVIVVVEQPRIDELSPEMFKELLEIAGLNNGKLHLVIPDALQGKYSQRLAELRKVATVYYGFPQIAASDKIPVIGFSDMERDGYTLADFKKGIDSRLAERMKDSAFGLNRPGSFGVGILYALKDIPPDRLPPNRNGFRYDPSGWYSAQVLEVLKAYTVISTSA